MSTREPTALTRELGHELKTRRLASGMKADDLAVKMQWSPAKISRIETGQRLMDEVDLVFYLAHCGAKKQDLDELLPLNRDVGRGWWMKERLKSIIFHENRSVAHQSYAPLAVPGLLQTESYARAMITHQLGPFEAPNAVGVRMHRQQILHNERRPIDTIFYVHEQVLDLPVGGNQVMNEQMLHLVLVSDRPNISIRVVPRSLGERSVFGCENTVYHFREERPLLYQENGFTGWFLDDVEYIGKGQGMMTKLAQVALGEEESRELFAIKANKFDRPASEGCDNPADQHPQQ